MQMRGIEFLRHVIEVIEHLFSALIRALETAKRHAGSPGKRFRRFSEIHPFIFLQEAECIAALITPKAVPDLLLG